MQTHTPFMAEKRRTSQRHTAASKGDDYFEQSPLCKVRGARMLQWLAHVMSGTVLMTLAQTCTQRCQLFCAYLPTHAKVPWITPGLHESFTHDAVPCVVPNPCSLDCCDICSST